MNNKMFQKMYKTKAKRVRDPNLPPPPTLLGQVKVIKDVQNDIGVTRTIAQQQQYEIDLLKRELRRANHRIELLTNHLRNNKK